MENDVKSVKINGVIYYPEALKLVGYDRAVELYGKKEVIKIWAILFPNERIGKNTIDRSEDNILEPI